MITAIIVPLILTLGHSHSSIEYSYRFFKQKILRRREAFLLEEGSSFCLLSDILCYNKAKYT